MTVAPFPSFVFNFVLFLLFCLKILGITHLGNPRHWTESSRSVGHTWGWRKMSSCLQLKGRPSNAEREIWPDSLCKCFGCNPTTWWMLFPPHNWQRPKHGQLTWLSLSASRVPQLIINPWDNDDRHHNNHYCLRQAWMTKTPQGFLFEMSCFLANPDSPEWLPTELKDHEAERGPWRSSVLAFCLPS